MFTFENSVLTSQYHKILLSYVISLLFLPCYHKWCDFWFNVFTCFIYWRFSAPGCTFVQYVYLLRAFWDMVFHHLSWLDITTFGFALFLPNILSLTIGSCGHPGMCFSSISQIWEESTLYPWRVERQHKQVRDLFLCMWLKIDIINFLRYQDWFMGSQWHVWGQHTFLFRPLPHLFKRK